MIKKSAKKYEKEKYVENQTQNIEYKKRSIGTIMQCDCYMKNADTKKIKRVK